MLMARFLAVSRAVSTSPAASARQQTATASGASRTAPASVPTAYSATVSGGPSRSARRRAVRTGSESDSTEACELDGNAVGSLILDHIPEPLVGTGVLDPLHLGRVRDPVDGVGLAGELAHAGDGRGDLLKVLGNRGMDRELRAEQLGHAGHRGGHRLEQDRQAGQEHVQVQGVLRPPPADVLAHRLNGSVDLTTHDLTTLLGNTTLRSARPGSGW